MNSGSCIVKSRHHENGLLKYFVRNYKHVCSETSMSAVKAASDENNTAKIYRFCSKCTQKWHIFKAVNQRL